MRADSDFRMSFITATVFLDLYINIVSETSLWIFSSRSLLITAMQMASAFVWSALFISVKLKREGGLSLKSVKFLF